MNVQSRFALGATILVGLGFVAGFTLPTPQFSIGRVPSSLGPSTDPVGMKNIAAQARAQSKWMKLKGDPESALEFQKNSGPIEIQIQPSEPGRDWIPGEAFRVVGLVTTKIPISDVEIRWNLPPGMKVVSGNLEDKMYGMAADETRTVEILVQSSSEENEQIHLHAYQAVAGEAQGSVAQFNTHSERSDLASEASPLEKARSLEASVETQKRNELLRKKLIQ